MKAAQILILHKPFMNCNKVVESLSGAAPPSLYTPVYTSAQTSYFATPYQAGDELKMQFFLVLELADLYYFFSIIHIHRL